MVAITQKVSNYLGGVSSQSDDKKLPGQVRECLNGYPDPTFGLTKRPGFKFTSQLKNTSGTVFTNQLDNAKWFYIHRDGSEKYIGCITPYANSTLGNLYVWNADTGVACTITYGSNAQNYLSGIRTNYDVLTVQDTTIITNNSKTVAAQAAPTFIPKTRATLILNGEPSSGEVYTVVINDGSTDHTITATAGASETYDTLLATLKTSIQTKGISGITASDVRIYDNSIQIDRIVSGTRTAFSITSKGGLQNSELFVFQDWAENVSSLPPQSFHNHVVQIINTASIAEDNYFAKFVADDGVLGRGYWEESIDPQVSPGLDAATMPHELVNTGTNAFTLKQITWTNRLAGDDLTNPQPSFVTKKIEQSFFHNNRLGFLSGDSVIMSQSGEYYNFYHITARTVSSADPIDLSCSTIRPAALHSVLPTTQGLVLFASNQQFMLYAEGGILTPQTALIKTISNMEMDTTIDPVDIGTHINFISKTPNYTRVFSYLTRGQEENPQVLDIGRIVNEWVPANIDTLIASPQNQFLAMSSQSSDYIYIFRTYNDGKEQLMQSWFNWKLAGTVQTIAVDSDDMFSVTKQGSNYTLSIANLSQSPEQAIIVNNQGQRVNPCIDLYSTATNGLTGNNLKTVVYDATNDLSKCYLPYTDVTTLTPVLVIAGSTAAGNFVESGFTITPERGSDSSGAYFIVPRKNLESQASNVIVGFKYDLNVELPKTYFYLDEKGISTDYTATLTVARMKFAVGLSGVMSFKLKTTGRLAYSKTFTGDDSTTNFEWLQSELDYIDKDQVKVKVNNVLKTLGTDYTFPTATKITFNSAPDIGDTILVYIDEWYNLNPTSDANNYLANDVPLNEDRVFTIPIHQKTKNFSLRVFNDSPFPVSLNSMMWEGNYSPRYYRRT